MRPLLIVLAASLSYAGQGIALGPGQYVYNNSIKAISPGTPYRIEESLQSLPTSCEYLHTFGPNIVGANIVLECPSETNQFLLICPGDNSGCYYINTYGLPGGFLTFRFQHFPSTSTDVCQAWDINGTKLYEVTQSYTAETTYSAGVAVSDGNGGGYAINYARIYSATVGVNSRPPVTADTTTGLVFEWKFDGNLADSGPGGYTGILASGIPTYVATLGQSLVAAVATSTNASPPWPASIRGYQPSWRAGQAEGLSCASSYSQSDSDPNVSCFWQVLLEPGQSAPFWSDQRSQTPTLTGLLFGDYAVQLTVSDQAGNTGTSVTHIGAVATDDNGVVVNANPAADAIFGPMIAFGKNPWSEADYWHLAGSIQRYNQYLSYGLSSTWPYATWEQSQAGTVSYQWEGNGMAWFNNQYNGGTTITGTCSATATTCTVANASLLDLTELPARVYIWSPSQSYMYEEIRVCSVSGNTLTLCYDGRGWTDPNTNSRLGAQSWSTGSLVGQEKVAGTGTAFLSTLCPSGPQGPAGVVAYSTGTAAVTAGSTTATLAGGAWASTVVYGGEYLVVSATHSRIPFTFVSPIASLTDSADVVLTRPFPSDADTASGLTYSIVQPNVFADLGYMIAQGSGNGPLVPFTKNWAIYGCESNTSAYMWPQYDEGALGTIPVTTAQPYSYQSGTWWYNGSSTGGLDYYSEDLANLAGWLRSGLKQFHDSSMMIGDIWIRHPQRANGGGGPLLTYGGPVVGGIANAVLSDTGHGTQWKDVRSFARYAIGGYPGVATVGHDCNNDDSREHGYQGAFLAMAAEFDPDTTSNYAPGGISWHQYWQNALGQYATNEENCANQFGNTDNSWRSTFYGWEGVSGANGVTLANGSTAGTGSGLSSGFCFGIGQAVNVTVTNGSSVVTGTGFPTSGWKRVAITGAGLINSQGNVVPTLWVYATPNSSTQFTISYGATWPGSNSSTASVMFDNADNVTSFMSVEVDPMSQQEWSCIYNSPTSVTLNRPWTGTNSTYGAYSSNITGFAVQPFMLGIRQYAWLQAQQASAATQPSVSARFAALRNEAGCLNTAGTILREAITFTAYNQRAILLHWHRWETARVTADIHLQAPRLSIVMRLAVLTQ